MAVLFQEFVGKIVEVFKSWCEVCERKTGGKDWFDRFSFIIVEKNTPYVSEVKILCRDSVLTVCHGQLWVLNIQFA